MGTLVCDTTDDAVSDICTKFLLGSLKIVQMLNDEK